MLFLKKKSKYKKLFLGEMSLKGESFFSFLLFFLPENMGILSNEQIQAFENGTLEIKDLDECFCVICQQDIPQVDFNKNNIILFPCRHYEHKACSDLWNNFNQCSICVRRISNSGNNYFDSDEEIPSFLAGNIECLSDAALEHNMWLKTSKVMKLPGDGFYVEIVHSTGVLHEFQILYNNHKYSIIPSVQAPDEYTIRYYDIAQSENLIECTGPFWFQEFIQNPTYQPHFGYCELIFECINRITRGLSTNENDVMEFNLSLMKKSLAYYGFLSSEPVYNMHHNPKGWSYLEPFNDSRELTFAPMPGPVSAEQTYTFSYVWRPSKVYGMFWFERKCENTGSGNVFRSVANDEDFCQWLASDENISLIWERMEDT